MAMEPRLACVFTRPYVVEGLLAPLGPFADAITAFTRRRLGFFLMPDVELDRTLVFDESLVVALIADPVDGQVSDLKTERSMLISGSTVLLVISFDRAGNAR